MPAGRPKIYDTEEQRIEAIRNSARKAYLKRINRSDGDDQQRIERIRHKKYIKDLKSKFRIILQTNDTTAIELIMRICP